MKKFILTMFLTVIFYPKMAAQNLVKGTVVDSNSEKPIEGVSIILQSSTVKTKSNGTFILENLPNGKFIVTLKLKGYETQNFPIQLEGNPIDLGTVFFYEDSSVNEDLSTITIADDELNDDNSTADHISGLLQSSKDIYLRSAAFEFSASFFRIKGLDSDNALLLINGIEMNKIYSGRPQWSNWGGLNDATRNQEFSSGLAPSNYTFGGVLGATNINVRASDAKPGGRISYASANRSYEHRIMATYSSGLTQNNWAYTISVSRRAGKEGFNEGTFYDANSFFASVEKKINSSHSINFTAIYTPNKRGKSSANTQEVYDLKGIQYNSYWGMQNGRMRNARQKRIVEPIVMLNHYWIINKSTTLNTNVAYQFGEVANSRIDYNGSKIDGSINGIPTIVSLGGANPDPTYYQKLPSYGLKKGYPNVYEMEKTFIENGQLDWTNLYQKNSNPIDNGYAAYVLYDDRNDDKQFSVNSIFEAEINENITLNASIQYRNLSSDNFAQVTDLFGGTKFLDVDSFANTNTLKQNDLQHPNREVTVGDKFKYNYNLTTNILNGFAQAQFKYNKIDFYTAASISNTTHQRNGLYKNGKFATGNASLGKSDKPTFTNYGFKGGATYKFTGRHLVDANAGYLTKAPTLRNAFSNARINNDVVENLTSEKIFSADASYIFRSPNLQAKATGYYAKIKGATEVSFYYADGVGGSGSDYTAFVQEILTEIDKKNIGIELGLEAQVTASIKLKGAANMGQYIYDSNPTLTLKSEIDGFQFASRASNLKNYKLAAGPQQAYSVGFEYRDPDYWWFGATINFFANAYVDVAPLTRTSNFTDNGGIPFNDYDPELAKTLLQQEKFDSYNVINLVGGKSWKINDYYISLFASISNLQNTKYKTGGFEQGRNANYRELRDDKALDKPIFGPKYWFGRGATYFLNVSFRF
ncbi:carboxypeptidase-like regulatory domain-containing protein [Polaribacter gochangensis]|uniref:carboxypeptidase-like regulatory domain-containing protein n=1 Tax=Polaribacter gochangensis TaxID=3252903 RepID=UPI0039046A64